MPDTFFRNEKEAKFHDIIQPNLYVRVFPNGDVLYSIRVSVTPLLPLLLRSQTWAVCFNNPPLSPIKVIRLIKLTRIVMFVF